VILILLGIIIFTVSNKTELFSDLFSFVVTPVQKVATEAANTISEMLPDSTDTDEYKKKIKSLETEVEKLRAIAIDYYNIKKENIQYEKYYELKKQHKSLKFAASAVIGNATDGCFPVFTVDQGTFHGVNERDTVMGPNGVIGIVQKANVRSCIVKTILSPEVKIGGICARTGDIGVITGDTKYADQNLTRMRYLPPGNTLKRDDIIVTSGVGESCPRNLPIGKVLEVKKDENDGSPCAVFEPFEDIRNIQDVFIIIDFEGKGSVDTEPATPQP
jgi:rod shape-determining protein MreC